MIKIIHITGPTNTGKTAIVRKLTNLIDFELINSDKFHLFKGFDISTGYIDSSYEEIETKHLYQILEKGKRNTLPIDEYLNIVAKLVEQIGKRNKIVVIEGCSYSYNKELYNFFSNSNYDYLPLACEWLNEDLFYKKIVLRIENLINLGVLNKTEKLISNSLSDSYVVQKGIFIRYFIDYLNNELTLEETIKIISDHIFVNARHQLLRFKKLEKMQWINTDDLTKAEESVLNKIRHITFCISNGRESAKYQGL